MKRFQAVLLAAVALALTAALPATASPSKQRTPVDIQLLSVSDWHAQLDPLFGGVGGAAVLSSYWKSDRMANPNTLTFTAGDAYGGSPPLSAFFDEEPAVGAMNLMGFTADTLGNHNFDKGVSHLQSMIDLAQFDYVSSNLIDLSANLSGVVAPYAIYEVGGVKVGVVGVTNPEAPTLVFPGSFGTILVGDPVSSANKARAQAQAAGAKVTIALTHLGVTGFDSAGNAFGPLIDFANEVGGFDVIYGDHTDVQFSAVIGRALVIENRSRGANYSKTTLTVDPHNGRIVSRSNQFVVPVASAVTPDPAIVSYLAPFRTALAAKFDQPIGKTSAVFPRGGNIERLGEVAIGNLVTDAFRTRYGTQIAITNGGGIRQSLPSNYTPLATGFKRSGCTAAGPCDLLLGDPHAVLPFGNAALTRRITGAQLHAALEHSVAPIPAASGRFLQISGFKFSYDATRPAGSRVVSVQLNDGTPILADSTTYSVAMVDFINAGGDGYTMFADGQGTTRDLAADVLADYIRSFSAPLTPTIEGRITRLG